MKKHEEFECFLVCLGGLLAVGLLRPLGFPGFCSDRSRQR